MIVASFDKTQNRTAAVSGAYQYDTGQRLAMHGLPSPSELAGRDDLLSGDLVTVQAQFSYKGDTQAQMRLAVWDEQRGVWMVGVPDEYLTRHRDVHVYVFCYYGADDAGERAKTAYEATFRPISRPAPSGTVTEDQLAQWEELKAEIEISLSKVETAIDNATKGAENAQAAAEAAQENAAAADAAAKDAQRALNELNAAGLKVGTAGGDGVSLAAGSDATADLALDGTVGRLTIGSPVGADGQKGETGDKGPADLTFDFDADTATLTITTKGEE